MKQLRSQWLKDFVSLSPITYNTDLDLHSSELLQKLTRAVILIYPNHVIRVLFRSNREMEIWLLHRRDVKLINSCRRKYNNDNSGNMFNKLTAIVWCHSHLLPWQLSHIQSWPIHSQNHRFVVIKLCLVAYKKAFHFKTIIVFDKICLSSNIEFI